MCTKIHKLIILNLFSKLKFLGCYRIIMKIWLRLLICNSKIDCDLM